MKRFKVTYIPTYDHDDICSIWVNAKNATDAKIQALDEYWDIYNIESCYELD